MSSLPPCDTELFKNGDVVGIYVTRDGAASFEQMIKEISKVVGFPVDWNYAAGRAVVRCQPKEGNAEQVYKMLSNLGYEGAR